MRTVALEPMHRWAIAQRLQQVSDDLLRAAGPAASGPPLAGASGLDHGRTGASENTRRARFYSLARAGRKLDAELSKWRGLSAGVNLVLERT